MGRGDACMIWARRSADHIGLGRGEMLPAFWHGVNTAGPAQGESVRGAVRAPVGHWRGLAWEREVGRPL